MIEKECFEENKAIDTNQKLKKAFKIANNAIYFDDSSDYLTALYEICGALKPELHDDFGENYGKNYIE